MVVAPGFGNRDTRVQCANEATIVYVVADQEFSLCSSCGDHPEGQDRWLTVDG